MPPLPFTSVAGAASLAPSPGRALLLVLWASWCRPCAAELAELQRRSVELAAAGVDVVALTVQGLTDGSAPTAAQAAAQAQALGFVGTVGVATPPLMAAIEALHSLQSMLHQPLPLPTSVLIDVRGDMAAVYKGAVIVDRVIADAAIGSDPVARAAAATVSVDGLHLVKGRWIAPTLGVDWPTVAHQLASSGLANLAVALLEIRLRRNGQDGAAYNDLGVLLARMGAQDRARVLFERAVALAPDDRQARENLARLHP